MKAACLLLTAGLAVSAGRPPLTGPELQAAGQTLAGLPGSDGLAGSDAPGWRELRRSEAFATHQRELSAAWRSAQSRRLRPMARFSERELAGLREPQVLLYPFAGPDLLHARVLFPGAATYVLVGLEPVGDLPRPGALRPEAQAAALAQVRQALATSLRLSFFVTRDMARDLRGQGWSGVLPLLLVDAALLGDQLRSAEFLSLDAQGRPLTGAERPTGVRLTFSGPGSPRERTVYYWQQDCSNQRLGASGQPFLAFLERLGPTACFLKSASYLLHQDAFSRLRERLLEQSVAVLQDDSGIPHHCFTERHWQARAYGAYVKPISDFSWCLQKDLAALFNASPGPGRLDFFTGYGRQSNLVCYRAPDPEPVPRTEHPAPPRSQNARR